MYVLLSNRLLLCLRFPDFCITSNNVTHFPLAKLWKFLYSWVSCHNSQIDKNCWNIQNQSDLTKVQWNICLFIFVDYILNSFWLCEFYRKISWLWLCQLLCKLSLTLSTLSNGVNRRHTTAAGEAQPPLLKHSSWPTDFWAIRVCENAPLRWL